MSKGTEFVAVDLGAESGRVVLAQLAEGRMRLEPVHRFANGPVQVLDHLHWDILRLFSEVKQGIARCGQNNGAGLAGIAVSTWGVDFALLDEAGELLRVPYCYRDPRTEGMMDRVFARMPRDELFRHTGIQFMPLNSLYQLYATALTEPKVLDAAATFLMIPDLLNYWLSGVKSCELTIASTSQLLAVDEQAWARPVLDRLALPASVFPELVAPGTVLGALHGTVADAVALPEVPIIASAAHDTAAAVAATPVLPGNDQFAYINSGTWSIIGLELDAPVISDSSLEHNFTNERGVGGKYMYRKNNMGLWLLQECRREWAGAGQSLGYAELTELAARAPVCGPIVEPDHESFLAPGAMTPRIAAFCRATGQTPPDGIGATVRCVLESLALKYRWIIDRLEETTGRAVPVVHLMGGGSKSSLLCRATANATGRRVIAGPAEATVAGNVMLQAIATGHLDAIAQGRAVVRDSFALTEYEPQDREQWEAAYKRFLAMRESTSTWL